MTDFSKRRRKKSSTVIPALIVLAAIVIWIFDVAPFKDPNSSGSQVHEKFTEPPSLTGNYKTYSKCTLVPNRGNDGDSFSVRFPDGKTAILRLYFVDAPENAFKTYRNGHNNHQRIQDQANALGSITLQQAVEIGQRAQIFTLKLLGKSTFTVHTQWHSPFNDDRFQAFIEITDDQKHRFLHERLVENGLARIHTKGAPLPDGSSERKQKTKLFKIQRSAQSKPIGAWAF